MGRIGLSEESRRAFTGVYRDSATPKTHDALVSRWVRNVRICTHVHICVACVDTGHVLQLRTCIVEKAVNTISVSVNSKILRLRLSTITILVSLRLIVIQILN